MLAVCTARFTTIIVIKQHQHFDPRFTFVQHDLLSRARETALSTQTYSGFLGVHTIFCVYCITQ